MNITYLIGAGASYNVLPILKELPNRLNYLISELNGQANSFKDYDEHQKLKNLIKDLDWLVGEVKNHQTVDTFARKLFLNTRFHGELRKFKAILTIYFLFEQSFIHAERLVREEYEGAERTKQYQGLVDKRYDSFIASLISNKIDKYEMNPSVKVLSWNYDSQFEIAFKRFNGMDLSIDEVHKHLQIMPSKSIQKQINLNNFAIIKLNGTASYYQEGKQFYDWIGPIINYVDYYSKLLSVYNQALTSDNEIGIQYAWESEEKTPFYSPYAIALKENIREISNQTDILVVIGYSFPIFNRKVDKEIIDSMLNLKKIYIQDKDPQKIASIMRSSFRWKEIKEIKTQDDIISKGDLFEVPIIMENNTDSFLLPPELN